MENRLIKEGQIDYTALYEDGEITIEEYLKYYQDDLIRSGSNDEELAILLAQEEYRLWQTES
jgi:hypothetical protein